MKTLTIEGILITPEILDLLRTMQDFQGFVSSPIGKAIDILLVDDDEVSPTQKLEVLKDLNYVRKKFIEIEESKKGGEE